MTQSRARHERTSAPNSAALNGVRLVDLLRPWADEAKSEPESLGWALADLLKQRYGRTRREIVESWIREPDEPQGKWVRRPIAHEWLEVSGDLVLGTGEAWVVDPLGASQDDRRVRVVDLIAYFKAGADLLGPAGAAYRAAAVRLGPAWLRGLLEAAGRPVPACLADPPPLDEWPGFPSPPQAERDEWVVHTAAVCRAFWRRHGRQPSPLEVWSQFRRGKPKAAGITVTEDGLTAAIRGSDPIEREDFVRRWRRWTKAPED